MATAQRTQAPRGVVKRLLLGRALASHKAEHQLLPKLLALPVFSSDALSSSAYATEEIMRVLVLAGAGALALTMPLAWASWPSWRWWPPPTSRRSRPTPTGAGATSSPRRTWAPSPGWSPAAALLVDYVLTVAVSVSAGIAAVVGRLPGPGPHRVGCCCASWPSSS